MINTEGKTIVEVCTEIIETLIKQGGRCMVQSECAYGDEQGGHCALGWLLPDDDLVLMNFGGGVGSLLAKDFDLGPNDKFINEHKFALAVLQDLHDSFEIFHTRQLPEGIPQTLIAQWMDLNPA